MDMTKAALEQRHDGPSAHPDMHQTQWQHELGTVTSWQTTHKDLSNAQTEKLVRSGTLPKVSIAPSFDPHQDRLPFDRENNFKTPEPKRPQIGIGVQPEAHPPIGILKNPFAKPSGKIGGCYPEGDPRPDPCV
jgi:hypothetical protein